MLELGPIIPEGELPETEPKDAGQSQRAYWFNLGSDARLAGEPLDNARQFTEEAGTYWKWGWHHVNANYARDARWPVMPLPPVRERRRAAV